MALDPSQTVDVQHPQTGQIITIPASVAQMAGVTPDMIVPRAPPAPPPGLNIGVNASAPAPYSGEIAAAPAPNNGAAPAPTALGAPLPSPGTPSAPPAGQGGGPMFSPSDLAAVKSSAPAGAAPAAPGTPSPQDQKPLTTQGLRDMGTAGAANAQTSAIDDAAKAGAQLADVQAKQQQSFAQAYTDRNDKIDGLVQQRADAIKQQNDAINARMTDYDAAVKAYGSTKIDRSLDHPITSAISLALGAIGAAMVKSGDNPAMKALNDAIDRKVQTQMANREGLANTINMKRGDIDMLRQRANDQTAQYNLMIAGESEKAARQIETITAQSNSDIVKANGAQAAAALRQKAADVVGQAVMQQQAKDNRDQEFAASQKHLAVSEGLQRGQLGLGYAQLAQSKDQFNKTYALDIDKIALEAGKGNQKLAEQLTDQGMMVPTGIASSTDGTVKPTFGYAKQQDGTPYIMPKEEAKEIRSRYAGTTQAIDAIDQLRQLRSENGGNFTSWSPDARAKAQEMERVLIGMHEASGITGFRGNIMDVMKEQVTGGADPTSVLQSVMPELDRARDNMIKDLNSHLHTKGNYTGNDISFPDPLKLKTQTSADDQSLKDALVDPRQNSSASDIANSLGVDPKTVNPFISNANYNGAVRDAWTKAGGMVPGQRGTIDTLGRAIADPNTPPDTLEKASSQLRTIATESQLPAVREYAQSVASAAAVTRRAPSSREDLENTSSSTAQDQSYGGKAQTMPKQALMRNVTIPDLRAAAIAGDADSKRELLRRQSAGDKGAVKALQDVIKSVGTQP